MMTLEPVNALHASPGVREPAPPAIDRGTDRWEDEGGAQSGATLVAQPGPVPARSHPYGEGQTQRTITQDEQDRLARSRHAFEP